MNLQNQALTTATNLIPNAPTGAATASLGLLQLCWRRCKQMQMQLKLRKDNIQKFFGGFTQTGSGRTDKETEASTISCRI